MHDWMHVMVRYCDGGSFSGTAEHLLVDQVLVEKQLQFRMRGGHDGNNTEPPILHMQGRAVLKV